MVITLDPELEAALGEQARRRGIPPEALALSALREWFLGPPAPVRPRQLGTLKGTVRYMAPDFDAPLEDFKEYME